MNFTELIELFLIVSVGLAIVVTLLSCYIRFFRQTCCPTRPRKRRRRLSYPKDSVTNITLISCQQTDSDLFLNSATHVMTENL